MISLPASRSSLPCMAAPVPSVTKQCCVSRLYRSVPYVTPPRPSPLLQHTELFFFLLPFHLAVVTQGVSRQWRRSVWDFFSADFVYIRRVLCRRLVSGISCLIKAKPKRFDFFSLSEAKLSETVMSRLETSCRGGFGASPRSPENRIRDRCRLRRR